jgi:hypothetical protein
MVEPMLIPTIPPSPWGGGKSHPVVSNLFDSTGNFCQCGLSFKWARRKDKGMDGRKQVFDIISLDDVPFVLLAVLKLDLN